MPQATIAALTDTGREHNEDAHLVARIATGHGHGEILLLGVFDGCGGASSGRVASDMAAEVVASAMRRLTPEEVNRDLSGHLEHAVRAASDAIYAKATGDRKWRGMGTTATVAAVQHDVLHLAHVGDSRAYLLRLGRLAGVRHVKSAESQPSNRPRSCREPPRTGGAGEGWGTSPHARIGRVWCSYGHHTFPGARPSSVASVSTRQPSR